MKKLFSKFTLTTGIAGWAMLASATDLPGPIVTTEWLAANLQNVQIVDVRSNAKSFAELPEFETDAKTGKKTLQSIGGHITGATLIDFKAIRTERQIGELKVKYMIPEQAAWEKLARTAGINANKPIVLVPVGLDTADVDEALRVYWQFKVYGENNVAVLDGGMAEWLIEGRPFDQSAIKTNVAGNWAAKGDLSSQYLATSEDVAQAIANQSATTIDARDLKSYFGLTTKLSASRKISSNVRLRSCPLANGIMQKLHIALQPSWILSKARVESGSAKCGRSKSPRAIVFV